MKNLKINSVVVFLILTLTLYFIGIETGNAQPQPTFNVHVRNLKLGTELGGVDNFLQFDIYLLHTNFAASGPFKLSFHQYFFNFNPDIANGGTLSYTFISSELPSYARPQLPRIVGDIFYLVSNNPFEIVDAPEISTMFPGTKVATMQVETTAPLFDMQSLSLDIRTPPEIPSTKIFAYIGPTSFNITSNGTNIVDPSINIVLPVELENFSAVVNRNNVTLNWKTNKETNNTGFDIERKSTNSIEWTKVGFVQGNGTTTNPKSYSFFDENINSGKYNYRLKQIDFNGNFDYFNLSNDVVIGIPSSFNLSQNYPNPFNPTTKINFELPKDGNVKLSVYDNSGKLVSTITNGSKIAGYYTMEFNASNIASGIYYFKIEYNSGEQNFEKVIKMAVLK